MPTNKGCRNAVNVWVATAEAAQLFDPKQLSDPERDRLACLRSPVRRQEFCVSRALQQHCLTSAAPASLTHSGGLAALAVGPPGSRIGVDLELHRPRRHLSIARFAYSVEEAEWLAAETDERASLFYTLWVAKEAIAKALGIGLVEALRNCRLLRRDGVWRGTLPTRLAWNLTVLRPRADLSLALALVGPAAGDISLRTAEWPRERDVVWQSVLQLSG
jgi:phosphopantetheinyl transferase